LFYTCTSMAIYRFTVVLFGIALAYIPGYGQAQDAVNTKKEYRIPFVITDYNNISIEAIINGVDTAHLMLHTAASSMTLIEEAAQRASSIRFDGTDTGVKSWGGQENSSRYSNHNSLQIGDMVWKDIQIGENKFSGQQTDGKVGLDLFAGRVVVIDYAEKMLTIRNELPNVKRYQKLKLTKDGDLLFIEVGCRIGDAIVPRKFLIHSGYSGALLLDDKFVTEHRLGETLTIVGSKELKDSFGNVLKTQKAVLPSVRIGHCELKDVSAGFFEGAIGRQKMSVMGGEVLRRFKIVLDGERTFIYIYEQNS